MSSISEKTVIRSRPAPAALRIHDWPLRDEPLQTLFIIGLIVVMSVTCALAVRHPGVGILIFALLSLTVRRIWMPAVYELGSKGIIHSWLGRRRRVPWTEFARYEVHDRGVLLCADAEPQPFSSWRGFFIRWNGRRDELLAVLDFYLLRPAPAAVLSTRTLSHISSPLPPPSEPTP